jgi:recombinational DNA repair protein RecR
MVQDLKMEIETIKKPQREIIFKMKNQGKRSGTSDVSITNRIQKMEQRISGIKDTIEVMDTLVKENTKCENFPTQNTQEICDTMKRENLRIIGIEDCEEPQFKGPENIFNKIIKENFPT